MKHYFHFMFAGALLLGSLIIFNAQKSESSNQVSDKPDIGHMELLAEICSTQTAASSVPSGRHTPEVAYESVSGKLNHLDFLNSAYQQSRIKMQKLIHLELKPVIGKQSGLHIHHQSLFGDPPVA